MAQNQNNVLRVNVGSLKTHLNQLNGIKLWAKLNRTTVTLLTLWIQSADAAQWMNSSEGMSVNSLHPHKQALGILVSLYVSVRPP